jgi:hypothetical protein
VSKKLERLEWDFSKKSCPDEELGACLDWEYLREIISFDAEVAQRIVHQFIPIELHCPGAPIGRLVEWPDDPEMEARRADFETLRDLSKYFPRYPYLTLPADYRSRLLALRPSRVGYHVTERILETRQGEPVPYVWSDEMAGRFEVVSIGIDWTLSTTAITDRIQEIIEARRGDRTAEDPRGTAANKRVRDRLYRLGARRIWKSFAGDHGKILRSEYADLYSDQTGWMHAVDKAGKDIEAFRELLEKPGF